MTLACEKSAILVYKFFSMKTSMNISFSYILFSPWPISECILCSPGKRKNCQSHVLNDTSSLCAPEHFASQDWILFTNNENLHMLSECLLQASPGVKGSE